MFSVQLVGLPAVQARLLRAVAEHPQWVARALYTTAEKIMADSKMHYVPFDKGTLKGSGHVEKPEISAGHVSVTMGYGGAASAYALVQHEHLEYKHRIGQAKYLERPVLAHTGDVREALAKAVMAPSNWR